MTDEPTKATEPTIDEAKAAIKDQIVAYPDHPPESDFHAGYLAYAVDLYEELWGADHGDAEIDMAAKLRPWRGEGSES